MDYNSIQVEAFWKQYWKDNDIYRVTHESDKPKYYVLDMFPYPSGAGLHVGHPLGYIASDIFTRHKRMSGYNVLHPMGWDAFGLPAEEYAKQVNMHPAESSKQNAVRYKEQMSSVGLSFDWSREFATCDANYYKWTQWIFTELFNHYYDTKEQKAKPIQELVESFAANGNSLVQAAHSYPETFTSEEWSSLNRKEQEDILTEYRLAYRKVGYVNWCEELGTVLANDQVKDGLSERGGHPVEQKAMTQWYLRITAYAERLLNELDNIDWSDSLKTIQRNWIGRSEGASVHFQIDGHEGDIEVFTTRPDTIFGATYMVLAPEHELVDIITTAEQQQDISDYINYVKSKSEVERMADKEVTGAFTGAYAINPFTDTKIPIWIGEYVLKDYGTGAIMAVPSDDDRDNKFATKFGLEIIDVVDKTKYPGASLSDKLGIIINSDFINGMEVPDAITKMCEVIEERGLGRASINYKLRDANFSRQRYWGEPFPVKYDSEGIVTTLTKEELPLLLPHTDDLSPGKGGQSPLSRVTEWVNQDGFTRETDVMPAVAGSSWYFLRFMDPNNEEEFASPEAVKYWQDVDLYVGGAEHAVAHLMYARFWHKFLFDKGMVPSNEPFKRLVNQGMIQGGIEFIGLLKEKRDGIAIFKCAKLLKDLDPALYIKIPIKIEFVQDYGKEDSYLTEDSINEFIEWRPEFKDAIFECANGIYQNGSFTGTNVTHLLTFSETGKMSKSKFNVINPDEVIERYGSDCFRMYEMFLGPIQQSKPWDTNGIDGVYKFINKYWNLVTENELSVDDPSKEELKVLHTMLKKVDADIQSLSFNTAVSSFMICINDLRKLKSKNKHIVTQFTLALAPFAPFITEECWKFLGNEESVHLQEFPKHNDQYLVEDSIEYPICINGKKRGMASFGADLDKSTIEKTTLELDFVQQWLEGKTIKKVIVVPNRMVNIVI
jgi:leucyl-tRNA synthetase